MLDSPYFPNNPNAPNISYSLYVGEKAYFVGILIGGLLYGVVIALFFQCVGALLYPVDRSSGGINRGLAVHTVLMFLIVTIFTGTTVNLLSVSFVDNRAFLGIDILPPGPVGYEFLMTSNAIGIFPTLMVLLNNWLASGLLLHRCYVVYAMNYWAIAFPFFMYLASIVTGVIFISQVLRPDGVVISLTAITRFGAPFLSVTFSLDALLTFMIVAKLILHRKNLRNAMGNMTTNAGELYKVIATILIESFALNAVTFLIYIGLWGAESFIQFPFNQILAQIQVITSFLIILRVTNRRQLASSSVISGSIGPIDFRRQGKPTDGDDIFTDRRSTGSVDACEEIPLELCGEAETAIDRHHSLISSPEGSTGG